MSAGLLPKARIRAGLRFYTKKDFAVILQKSVIVGIRVLPFVHLIRIIAHLDVTLAPAMEDFLRE
jgi:hypothetical protein